MKYFKDNQLMIVGGSILFLMLLAITGGLFYFYLKLFEVLFAMADWIIAKFGAST